MYFSKTNVIMASITRNTSPIAQLDRTTKNGLILKLELDNGDVLKFGMPVEKFTEYSNEDVEMYETQVDQLAQRVFDHWQNLSKNPDSPIQRSVDKLKVQ